MQSGVADLQQRHDSRPASTRQPGQPVTIDPSCSCSESRVPSLISSSFLRIRCAGTHPPIVACVPGGESGALTRRSATSSSSTRRNWRPSTRRSPDTITTSRPQRTRSASPTYDPNVLFASLKASGNAHSGAPEPGERHCALRHGHVARRGFIRRCGAPSRLANELIGVINAKYGTTRGLP